MARRIEQSRKHGHHDPRWSEPLHAVNMDSFPVDVPEMPSSLPPAPTLRLVGGTDVTPDPEPLDQRAHLRA